MGNKPQISTDETQMQKMILSVFNLCSSVAE